MSDDGTLHGGVVSEGTRSGRVRTQGTEAVRAGTNIPTLAIRHAMASAFAAAVFPPVLGPDTTTQRQPFGTDTSTGTTDGASAGRSLCVAEQGTA